MLAFFCSGFKKTTKTIWLWVQKMKMGRLPKQKRTKVRMRETALLPSVMR